MLAEIFMLRCEAAAPQRLHEIDYPVGRGKGLPTLLDGAGLLGLEVRE
jgi:hypothetical protein